MHPLTHIVCVLYQSWIASSNITGTSFETTESKLSSSTLTFYTTISPIPSPTFMPTVNGEFPHIHNVQSYIECGNNIQLQDTMYMMSYAGFMLNKSIPTISVIFTVCKASSIFHYWDELYIWYGNDSTSWNATKLSPVLHSSYSADCTAFNNKFNISNAGTYFIGLSRYKGDEYGKYCIYMQCDTHYNSYIYPIPILPSYYAIYNQYHVPEFEHSNDIIGSISCDIIISSGIISQEKWHKAPNKHHFYSFTVTEYTEWIHISTCDATEKPHTLTLYYINGGDDWGTISYDISDIQCAYLSRNYLVPGTYYIGIDIINLLYNEYSLAMRCSSNNSVTVVTDYNPYLKPTPSPTSIPPHQIYTTITNESKEQETHQESSQSIGLGWIIAFISAVIAFVVGIYLGYKKYKKRNINNNDDKDNKCDLEMATAYGGVLSNEERNSADTNDSSSSDSSSSHETDESKDEVEVKRDNVAAEGGIAVEEGDIVAEDEGEGEVFIKRGIVDDDNNDIAPPAFAINIDYTAIPPMVEGVDVAIADYDEKEEVLPDEQQHFQIGSYCYVECDTVYGIVTGELQFDYYMIIDLFEKRKRKANVKTLSLIQDMKDLEKAKKQHERYKRRQRRKSSKSRKISDSGKRKSTK